LETKLLVFNTLFANQFGINCSSLKRNKNETLYISSLEQIKEKIAVNLFDVLFSDLFELEQSKVSNFSYELNGNMKHYNKMMIKFSKTRLAGIIIDTTPFIASAKDLEVIKNLYEITTTSAQVYPFVVDYTTQPVMFWGTDETAKFVGATPNKLMMYDNNLWQKLVKEINGQEVYEKIHDAMEAFKLGETDEYRVQYKMPSSNGSLRWIQSVSTLVDRDENGTVKRVYGVNIDINESKVAEENLLNIFNSTAIGITILRKTDGKVIAVNDSFIKILGSTSKDDFVGQLPGAYIEKYQIEGISGWDMNRDHYRNLLKDDYVKFTQKFHKVNGEVFWGEMEVTSSVYNNEEVYVCTFKNIDQLKEKQRQLEDSERSLKFAMDNANISIWEVDIPKNIGHLNEEFIKTYGGKFHQDNFMEFWAKKVHPQDRSRWLKRYRDGDNSIQLSEYRVLSANNEYIWIYSTGNVTEYDKDNKPLYMSGIIMDINDRKLQQLKFEELEDRVYHDSLTGLYNGKYLEKHVEYLKSVENLQVIAFHANISNFRRINEAYGFEFGDKVLKAVAEYLSSYRGDDQASEIFRVAGDEFLTFSVNKKVIESVVARDFETETTDVNDFKVVVDGVKIDIRMAVGACVYPYQTKNLDELVHLAEECMLSAKTHPEKKYVIYDEELFEEVRRERSIVSDATKADIDNEFEMYYQPIVNTDDVTDYQFESLLRWNNPRLGTLAPNQFIGTLEKSGHLKDISFYMIEKVVRQIAYWKKEYNKTVKVSFNVSESSLRSIEFTDHVFELIEKYKIDTSSLAMELVEVLIDTQNQMISRNLEQFRKAGIKISIDDFGVAYSNLLRLAEFEYNVLKVDKKFTNVVEREDSVVILEMIKKLTDLKGCEVVAEGVETKAQLNKLLELGVTKIQGFYFSVPLQKSDATKWLLKE